VGKAKIPGLRLVFREGGNGIAKSWGDFLKFASKSGRFSLIHFSVSAVTGGRGMKGTGSALSVIGQVTHSQSKSKPIKIEVRVPDQRIRLVNLRVNSQLEENREEKL
jgi:hypothetical protein